LHRLLKILPLLLLLTFTACNPGASPEETVHTFLDLIEKRDFPSLEKLAPFMRDLTPEEKTQIAGSLLPYTKGERNMDVQQLGLKTSTVLLSTGDPADRTLILTLEKGKDPPWILLENISYRRNIEFIPLEKKE
jgi:hypothetical protein